DGANAGEIMQWNGTQWLLVHESALVITERDSIIGNEISDATLGGSLERFGTGTSVDPYTLDVLDEGIGNSELGPDAVTSDKIFDGTIITADLDDGAVNSAKIENGTIMNADISPGAAIDGSKIIPEFVGDVSTSGIFIIPDFVFEKYFTGFSKLNNDYQFKN